MMVQDPPRRANSKRIDTAARSHDTARETLALSFATSSLGVVLVAESDHGVAAVLLGDERTSLRRDVAARFPNAVLVDADGRSTVAARVVELIDSPAGARRGTRFDLDVRGTEFQRAVWNALREIPRGETATYAEIAERIGHPTAVRGVAQACAANNIAILIPCHRVVRSDGAVSGYRWGVERKRELLSREQR